MPLLQRLSFILTFLISLLLSVNTIAAAKLDAHLLRLVDTNQTQHTIKELAKTFKDKQGRIRIHLFIEGDSSTLPALTALGVTINTVTSSGIMTATAPLNKIRAISEITGIRSLEASRTVKAFMNLSTGEDGVNLPDTTLERTTNAGNGVIIGIIDSGIDIAHGDFFDTTGNTRILSIWDHTLDEQDVSDMA